MCVCNCTCIHLITELWFTWRLSWSYCFATSAWDNWHQRLLQCSPQELEIICRKPLFLQQFPNLGQSKHYRTVASAATSVLMLQIMIGILFIFSHDRSAYTCNLCGGRSDRGRLRSSHGLFPIHRPVLPFILIDRLPPDILLGESLRVLKWTQ